MVLREDLGDRLAEAVRRVRERAGRTAAVAVVTPSEVNGAFARRELAGVTSFIRVSFVTPHALHRALALPGLRAEGLRPEPAHHYGIDKAQRDVRQLGYYYWCS